MSRPAHEAVRRRCRWPRHPFGLLLTALAAQSVSAQSPVHRADDGWPRPVAQFIERSGNCRHFAGEFGGDGSPRDAEVNRAMDKLRCNSLPADLRVLRRRYRADARVTTRLAAFDDDGMPKDDGTGD